MGRADFRLKFTQKEVQWTEKRICNHGTFTKWDKIGERTDIEEEKCLVANAVIFPQGGLIGRH